MTEKDRERLWREMMASMSQYKPHPTGPYKIIPADWAAFEIVVEMWFLRYTEEGVDL